MVSQRLRNHCEAVAKASQSYYNAQRSCDTRRSCFENVVSQVVSRKLLNFATASMCTTTVSHRFCKGNFATASQRDRNSFASVSQQLSKGFATAWLCFGFAKLSQQLCNGSATASQRIRNSFVSRNAFATTPQRFSNNSTTIS